MSTAPEAVFLQSAFINLEEVAEAELIFGSLKIQGVKSCGLGGRGDGAKSLDS